MSASILSEVQIGAARAMLVDAVAAEVVSALRAAGVRSLLLKGPALGAWMYDDSVERTYDDVDLLVSPEHWSAARETLLGLGFWAYEDTLTPESVERFFELEMLPQHAVAFWRERPRVPVDLHHTVFDAHADPRTVWSELSAGAEARELCGAAVKVPSRGARALIVALHAAWHGPVYDKVLDDLDRAVGRLPEAVWRDAAALAARIGALDSLAAGLRLRPPGRELAATLALPTRIDTNIALKAAGSPHTAVGFARLAATQGLRARAALIAGELVPPPLVMRRITPLARRGRLGLAAAYVHRPFWLARHAGPGLVAWRRARRGSRRTPR